MRAASAAYKTPLWTEYFSLNVPVGWISESTYCTLFIMKSDHKKFFFQFSWCHHQLDKFSQGVSLCSLRRKCFLLANLFLQMKIDQKPSAYLILFKFVKVLRKKLFLPDRDSHSFLETEIAFPTKKSQEFSHMLVTIIKITALTIASFIVKNEIC